MTTTASGASVNKKSKSDFDPESFRMTIGEHLEELRLRLVLGLIVPMALLFIFLIPSVSTHIVHWFLRPLILALEHAHRAGPPGPHASREAEERSGRKPQHAQRIEVVRVETGRDEHEVG